VETHAKQTIETDPQRAGLGDLPRKLGLISAIAVLVGTTIGTGIFRSPAGIAQKVPEEGWFLFTWVLGGFFTLCGALTYVELAGALPRTGGVFVYLREGFGKVPAFLFGWTNLVLLRASSLGAISTVFAEYFARLIHKEGNPMLVSLIAAGAILAVAVFNVVGVRLGALVQNLTTGTKYGALILLVIVAFVVGGQYEWTPPAEPVAVGKATSITMFGLALVSILWVYDGWADLTYVSGEVKRPERNLPLALIIGTLAVILIYLLANFAYLHLLQIDQIANSKLVAADTAERAIGGIGATLVSIAVMISAFGTLNGSILTGPRIFFAMADDGLFFRKIASVHPRFKTPYVAILLTAIPAMVFVMFQGFEQLADTFVLGIWPFYAMGVAAVYALRARQPNLTRPYRTLGYPVTPALFILAVMLLLANALMDDVRYYQAWLSGVENPPAGSGALMVFGIILLGLPVYWIWQRAQPKRA
jgi:APA family basic amino acid/polyamine antiporter